MKKIICTGDSHTWGQGASGLTRDFNSPITNGDLRWVNFKVNSYVNLLRNYINDLTGSGSCQYNASDRDFFKGRDILYPDGYVQIKKDGFLNFKLKKGIFRIQCRCGKDGGELRVLKNGSETGRFSTYSEVSGNMYKIINLDLEYDADITLKAVDRAVEIFKTEVYTGEYAVINSGVGSTTAGMYIEKYWPEYVESFNPDIVIIEAHSINDWLRMCDLKTYEYNLSVMFEKVRRMGSKAILLTVSPILGNQISSANAEYESYVKASREAALKAGIEIADAFAIMKNKLNNLSPEDQRKLMFNDNWHVNDFGHELYFEVIKNVLRI